MEPINDTKSEKTVKVFNRNTITTSIKLSSYTLNIEMFFPNSNDDILSIILIPPHYEFGGSMVTPLINNLFNKFMGLNFSVMRFSYPSFNLSYNFNSFDLMKRYTMDCFDTFLLSHRDLDKRIKNLFVIGLSTGAITALDLAFRRVEIDSVFLFSMPLGKFDCITWINESPRLKGLMMFSEKDTLTPVNVMKKYCSFIKKKKLDLIPYYFNTDHFFSDNNQEYINKIKDYIEDMYMLEI